MARLNIDVAGSISDFHSLMRDFEVKTRVYKTLFRGKGLEFDGYRTYSRDDDSSTIDWKASRRANKTLVKQYVEERDLKVLFVVDVGENMVFGSGEKLKCEYAGEVVAALAHLVIDSGDKAGVLLFGEKIREFIVPRGGDNEFYLIMDTLSKSENYGGASKINTALDYLLDYVSGDISSVVLVSDFLKLQEVNRKSLELVSSKFETMAVVVKDELDKTLPNISTEVVVEDYESGEQILINPRIARQRYEKYTQEQEEFMREVFKGAGIDFVEFKSGEKFVFKLAEFLKGRVSRKAYI